MHQKVLIKKLFEKNRKLEKKIPYKEVKWTLQCIKWCRYRYWASVNVHIKHQNGEKEMIFKYSHTIVSSIYKEWWGKTKNIQSPAGLWAEMLFLVRDQSDKSEKAIFSINGGTLWVRWAIMTEDDIRWTAVWKFQEICCFWNSQTCLPATNNHAMIKVI